MSKFEPWVTYKRSGKELSISVDGPPCDNCRFWNPQIIYAQINEVGNIFEGVRLCWSKDMHHDFSCYEEQVDISE